MSATGPFLASGLNLRMPGSEGAVAIQLDQRARGIDPMRSFVAPRRVTVQQQNKTLGDTAMFIK